MDHYYLRRGNPYTCTNPRVNRNTCSQAIFPFTDPMILCFKESKRLFQTLSGSMASNTRRGNVHANPHDRPMQPRFLPVLHVVVSLTHLGPSRSRPEPGCAPVRRWGHSPAIAALLDGPERSVPPGHLPRRMAKEPRRRPGNDRDRGPTNMGNAATSDAVARARAVADRVPGTKQGRNHRGDAVSGKTPAAAGGRSPDQGSGTGVRRPIPLHPLLSLRLGGLHRQAGPTLFGGLKPGWGPNGANVVSGVGRGRSGRIPRASGSTRSDALGRFPSRASRQADRRNPDGR